LSAPRRGLTVAPWARILGGVLVAVIGLAIAFRGVDARALGAALREASWSWFAAAMAIVVLSILVRAWRWRFLLAPLERIGLEPLFSATMIGYFGNGVLPLRLGEVMRAAAIGRRGGRVDASAALGSIAVERLLDVVSALAVAVLVVPFSGGRGGGVAAWSGAAALVLAAVAALFWASRSKRLRLALAARAEASRGGRLSAIVQSFLRGLLILGDGPALVPIALLTVVIWLAYGANVWMAARACGIELDGIETSLVLVAAVVAVSVPGAPGYVGTFHAAVVLVTSDLLGYPVARAQAFAILAHASAWLPTVLVGAVCLLRSSVRVGEAPAP
jgi:uncharacterized protein (TIRG00374 family)